MFEELLDLVEKKLRKDGEAPNYEAIIGLASEILIEDTKEQEEQKINQVVSDHDAFIKRNRDRWSIGFRKLHALREACLQAGMNFQEQFLSIPKYENDELIGVFLRQ
ncbi:MAG: hypothetical protein Q8R42_08990, partial [Desulfocapsaceae bacterium]|nr:hypothetical protein [Desulfocapsaceae bacterium]